MAEWLFTDQHRELRKTIRTFVKKELAPHIEEWEEREDLPRAVFKRMGELGFYGLKYPEAYGGSGVDWLADAVLQEEIPRCGSGGIAIAVGAHTGIATPPVYKYGTEAQKTKYLVPAIKGEWIGALGITEPNAGSDVAAISTTAVRQGDHYIINGSKIFITNGINADFTVLAAKTDRDAGHKGISLFIVDKGTPGFSAGKKLKKLGWKASDTAELIFNNCQVPVNNLLGEENKGFYYIMENFQWERLMLSLQFLGTAQISLDTAMDYVRQRNQFGRPLNQFQVIRHRLADLATELEAARQLTYYALWMYCQGHECIKEVSMAKLKTAEVAFQTADAALQMHGGYGYMVEYPIQRFWRDARVASIGGGTSEVMREIIAKRLVM